MEEAYCAAAILPLCLDAAVPQHLPCGIGPPCCLSGVGPFRLNKALLANILEANSLADPDSSGSQLSALDGRQCVV